MKFTAVLATAALALLGAASAHAQLPLSIDFTGTTLEPGGSTAYGGIIKNTSSSDVFLLDDGITVSGSSIVFDLITDPVLSPVPGPGGFKLAPGDSFNSDDLFELSAPSSGLYSLFDPNGTLVGQQGFTAAGTNVPEPGSVAMLVGMTMGGGLLMARRRRR
jgi:hypothetical protein